MATFTERLAILITTQGAQTTGEVQKLTGAFGTLGKAQLAAGAAAFGMGKFMLDAAEKTSALNEQASANAAIFGKASASIRQFGQTSANAFGLSERAALQGTNAIGGLFKQAGLAQQPAADLSVQTVKLAGDLASFRDVAGGAPEVLEKLRSGLTGEVEPLRNLGVFLTDATVRAKAVSMGLASAHSEVDDGAKILARYALIVEQTKDAQGDMARTSGSLANQQRQAAAAYEDAQAKFGQATVKWKTAFIRTGIDILGAADAVGGAISNLVQWGSKNEESTEANAAVTKRAAEEQRAFAESTKLATQRQKDNAAVLEAASKAQKEATKSAREHRDAVERLDDSHKSVAAAQRGAADAQEELNELEARGRVDKEAVARATESAAEASKAHTAALEDEARAAKDVESAQRDVADAMAAVEKIKQGATARELAEAELDLAAAQRDQRRAALDAKKAQEEVTGAVTVGILKDGEKAKTTEERERAQLDLEDANDRVKRSANNVEDAEKKLQEVQNRGKDGSKDLKDAMDQLAAKQDALAGKVRDQAAAHEQVAEKQRDQIKAGDELAKAEEADPDFAEKLRDARQKLADAHDDAARAKRNERDATEDLNESEATLDADRQNRLAALGGVMGPVAGRPGSSSSFGPGSNSVMGPVAGRNGLSSQFATDTDAFMGPVLARNGLNSTINNITVFTGADASAVQRAIEQYAARNGGSPRR